MQLATITAVFVAAVPAADDVKAPPPESVFPIRGQVEWGEGDARYGAWRGGRAHEGQDVFADAGTPIVSVRAGIAVEKGDDGGRGNYLAIWNRDARRTFVYLHMQRPSRVRQGERVRAGERIGAVGCTGSCWGNHLHLEVRLGRGTTGPPRDPLPLLHRLAVRAEPGPSRTDGIAPVRAEPGPSRTDGIAPVRAEPGPSRTADR